MNVFLSFVDTYAEYLRLYISAYANEGITIDYLVPQNEPLHSANGYPTMQMNEEAEIQIVSSLKQKLDQEGLGTKIVIYGHNWDNLNYAR